MKKAGKFVVVGTLLIFFSLIMLVSWHIYAHNLSYEEYFWISGITAIAIIGLIFVIYPSLKEKNLLRHMAFHDPLTGVGNRNKLQQHINEIISNSVRKHQNFAIILLDLDHFKNINDSIGHDAGDTLLQIIAERLQNTVRSTDMVARLGGDEFMVVITETKNSDAIASIAQKILNNILKKINIQGHEIYTTTSIGISMYPYDGPDVDSLLKNADLALYRAKEMGRNTFQFCTPEMTHKAQEKLMRQTALNHALIKEEFMLYYQPSLDVALQKITNVEALLRWQSKEYGFVTPDAIISLAEETGLIVPLSEWVLRTACKQVKRWHEAGFQITLSINISPRQFKQSDFIDKLQKILAETGLPPQCLILDVQESLIMLDPANARVILTNLKERGVKIVIDNFGTGYSSFGYLKNFQVDKIKIDKSFVRNLQEDPANLPLVSAMIAMATKLKIKAVAEGVETKEQYDLLVKEGCNEIQGYYVAKPMVSDQILKFLEKSKKIIS